MHWQHPDRASNAAVFGMLWQRLGKVTHVIVSALVVDIWAKWVIPCDICVLEAIHIADIVPYRTLAITADTVCETALSHGSQIQHH